MKRFLLLYSLFFVCHIIFAQTGYRYKGQFIELKTENTSYSFVMVNSSEAVALRNSISDYTEIRENCFIVKKEHRSNIDAINYESNIYTYNNGSVIVLPKIIFCVKDYFSLENIEQYDVSIEKINGNKYVLKCNVSI